MSAAIYAKRRGKNVVLIEKLALGGQVNTIPKIENFPSISTTDGISLVQKFSKQVEGLSIEIVYDTIQKVDYVSQVKTLFGQKDKYKANSVIIAKGLSYIELGKNENDYVGKGLSYCAVCDANFFKGEKVCVASKNGSGLKEAVVLSEVCEKVTVLDSGDMSIYAQVNKNPKIEVLSNVEIEKLIGKDLLTGVEIVQNGEKQIISCKGLFVALGKKPDQTVFGGVKVDQNGFIITDENMRTSMKGVFAVGDVRSKVLKQVVTACSDGAIAGQLA